MNVWAHVAKNGLAHGNVRWNCEGFDLEEISNLDKLTAHEFVTNLLLY